MSEETQKFITPTKGATTTRALKFEVVFPGMRRKDLLGESRSESAGVRTKKKRDELGLFGQLWAASDDLTRAANRAISILYQLRLGTLPWPEEPKARGKDKGTPAKVPIATLAYRLMNGAWQPLGEPCYVQTTKLRLASKVLCEAARQVEARLRTDFVDVRMGKKSLPTFRRLPIPVDADSVSVDPTTLRVTLRLWTAATGPGDRGKIFSIGVRHRSLDGGQLAILRRIADPEHTTKHGSGRLLWHQPDGRKGKWMLSLSWTGETAVVSPDKPLIAGVHLGMTTGASVAYLDTAGEMLRYKDLFNLPKQAMRSVQRLNAERKERQNTNRAEFGLRTGRGRGRKLRVSAALDHKVQRLTGTACQQIAAAVVTRTKERGAVAIGIEDLTRWSRDRAMDEALEVRGTRRGQAAFRQWYFRWLQGTIRAAIKSAAEREGLPIFEVDAAYDSRTCSSCNTRYVEPVEQNGVTYGRYKWRTFRCTCGVHLHADRNAALNVGRRTFEMWTAAAQQAAK